MAKLYASDNGAANDTVVGADAQELLAGLTSSRIRLVWIEMRRTLHGPVSGC